MVIIITNTDKTTSITITRLQGRVLSYGQILVTKKVVCFDQSGPRYEGRPEIAGISLDEFGK